jgi:hypothetical protein
MKSKTKPEITMSEKWQVMGRGNPGPRPTGQCERCRSAYATSEIKTTELRGVFCAPCASIVWDEHNRAVAAR